LAISGKFGEENAAVTLLQSVANEPAFSL